MNSNQKTRLLVALKDVERAVNQNSASSQTILQWVNGLQYEINAVKYALSHGNSEEMTVGWPESVEAY